MSDQIKLINHASILIEDETNLNILSDPWFHGTAFDDGWSLLYNNEKKTIVSILNTIKYIYISHEHPDHFSINFFKNFHQQIIKNKIKIIFHKTNDKRVETFLREKLNLELIILENLETVELEKKKITIIKCGSIDSSILIETENACHLNINDCDFLDMQLSQIKKLINYNKKIIIYMQFSYAAYRSDDAWLKNAADYKLKQLEKVYSFFNANLIIPFASFVYFSDIENFKLNKYMNSTNFTHQFLKNRNINHCILNPNETKQNIQEIINNKDLRELITNNSINFWDTKKKKIKPSNMNKKKIILSEDVKKIFLERIKNKNSLMLLYFIRIITFKFLFGDTKVYLPDINEYYLINFFSIKKKRIIKKKDIHLEMNSSRFNFLLKELYGLDSLSVNGCFKDFNNGFEKLIRSIGFVTLNQSDEGIKFKSIFSKLIFLKVLDIISRLLSKKS